MDFKDYYQTLGVERGADADAVKKAYRRLARKYHPDVSKEPDAAARMSEVNEAYAVLSDPEKRAAYDSLGRPQQHPGGDGGSGGTGRGSSGWSGHEGFQPPPGWASGFEFSGGPGGMDGDGADYSDFFESLFGHAAAARGMGAGRAGSGGAQQRAARGRDHHARIDIDLADAYAGATRAIQLRSAKLDAEGRVQPTERTLEVTIPKGVKEGQLIRLAGYGAPGGEGMPAGDLYLEVHFNPDARWHVEGRDVTQTLRVAPWEAALGGDVDVATPTGGTLQVTVPAGSASGRKLRLKGRGIPGSPAGDMYLVLDIVWPPADTPRARELYAAMARDLAFDPRAGTHTPRS